MLRIILMLLGFVATANAVAAPAVVQLLQAPVWRLHEGARTPLKPGEALLAGDSVVTGAGARLVIGLAEGSTVKLGENAELTLTELLAPAQESGVFKGFLNVVRGAFRFTTTVVGRQRDIRTRIGTVTIGIRGTDVWGKHEESRDFVVLLEGRISIERDGQSVTLDQAQSLYMAPAGQASLPVAAVDPEDLGRWAQETEPQAASGQRDAQGRYRLMFPLAATQAQAQRFFERLADAGYGAELASAAPDVWRVSMGGYTSEAEAQAGAAAVAAALGGARPWLSLDP